MCTMNYQVVLCACPKGEACPQFDACNPREINGKPHHLHPTDPYNYPPREGKACRRITAKQSGNDNAHMVSWAWPSHRCRGFRRGEETASPEILPVMCFECLKTCAPK